MKITTSKQKRVLTTVCALSLVGAMSAGCVERPDPTLVTTVQEGLAEGRGIHQQITTRISDLLTSFEVVEAVDLLVNEPFSVPVPDVAQTTLQAQEGLYQEDANAPGTFNYIKSPGAVTVQFLNGVKAIFSTFRYNGAKNLVSYTLAVSSSGVTPQADKVSMTLTVERLNALGFLPGIESGGLRMTGDVTLDFLGAPATFKVNRGVGQYTEPALTASHGQGYRYYLVNRGTNEFYRIDRVLTYIPAPDVAGKWVGQLGTESYSDRLHRSDVNLVLQNGAASLSQATYIRGAGGIFFKGVRYASLTGGPYACDLDLPLDPGFGVEIKFTYIGDVLAEENVFPGPQFSCADAGIPDPTL